MNTKLPRGKYAIHPQYMFCQELRKTVPNIFSGSFLQHSVCVCVCVCVLETCRVEKVFDGRIYFTSCYLTILYVLV